jgi:hypothetical protein
MTVPNLLIVGVVAWFVLAYVGLHVIERIKTKLTK